MKIKNNIWINAKQILDNKPKTSVRELEEVLGVTIDIARKVKWAYQNKHLWALRHDKFDTQKSALVLADLHIPYHNQQSIDVIDDYIKNKKYDYIILLGDIIDFYTVSYFKKDPERAKHKNLKFQIQMTRNYLTQLRQKFPEAEIIYLQGNHQQRLKNHIWQKVPELDCVLDKMFVNMLNLDELKIQYRDKFFKLGKLWFLHGHQKKGGNPEYICKVFFNYIHQSFIIGHFHRANQEFYKSISDNYKVGTAVGWLGNKQAADYAPLNKYVNGFAQIQFNKDGNFKVNNHTILNGEIY